MGNTTTDLSAVATVGLDLAKHVFQVHAVDAEGRIVTTRALRRKDVLTSSGPCHAAALAWKHAALPITGLAN